MAARVEDDLAYWCLDGEVVALLYTCPGFVVVASLVDLRGTADHAAHAEEGLSRVVLRHGRHGCHGR